MVGNLLAVVLHIVNLHRGQSVEAGEAQSGQRGEEMRRERLPVPPQRCTPVCRLLCKRPVPLAAPLPFSPLPASLHRPALPVDTANLLAATPPGAGLAELAILAACWCAPAAAATACRAPHAPPTWMPSAFMWCSSLSLRSDPAAASSALEGTHPLRHRARGWAPTERAASLLH